MTRKDTILVAVIINAGLLAVLFATAVIYDPDHTEDQNEANTNLVVQKPSLEELNDTTIATAAGSTGDEVDNVLNYYANPSQPMVVETNHEVFVNETQKRAEEDTPQSVVASPSAQNDFIEVIVKKGDILDKIAKSNGTSVSAIKKYNKLPDEKLKIGQVLRIPKKKEEKANPIAVSPTKETSEATESNEAVYYVVKSGDSPWKIARQFNVKYEDVLKLNNLNEEKARNLKVGNKIRIK